MGSARKSGSRGTSDGNLQHMQYITLQMRAHLSASSKWDFSQVAVLGRSFRHESAPAQQPT
jgi:hypothetical protein